MVTTTLPWHGPAIASRACPSRKVEEIKIEFCLWPLFAILQPDNNTSRLIDHWLDSITIKLEGMQCS
ncbi:hypothetical protein GJ744_010729 [Endocarpon pusillum]|uniref:Uncharacterized protein n=1 Tax=Endocarpon pusillum TaxID=364733 RepID=A0A8H7E3G3_9EURO|nr:hypothetical protein GJ744_010729 [Endocarpon pusillum]